MDNEMIAKLRKDDLKGDILASKILEIVFEFEDFEQSIGNKIIRR